MNNNNNNKRTNKCDDVATTSRTSKRQQNTSIDIYPILLLHHDTEGYITVFVPIGVGLPVGAAADGVTTEVAAVPKLWL